MILTLCGVAKTIPKPTGTVWTGIAHIITAVIGSGVLSLAWSTSQLGWIGGPLCLLCFALVTYLSASLLSDCYRSPHPVTGLLTLLQVCATLPTWVLLEPYLVCWYPSIYNIIYITYVLQFIYLFCPLSASLVD